MTAALEIPHPQGSADGKVNGYGYAAGTGTSAKGNGISVEIVNDGVDDQTHTDASAQTVQTGKGLEVVVTVGENGDGAGTVKAAWTTLITKPSYLQGLLVLHESFQQVGTAYPMLVLVTSSMPEEAVRILRRLPNLEVLEIESIRLKQGRHSLAKHDERFADTWTKLRAFGMEGWDRLVLMDCDMIVMRNMDELMTRPLAKDSVAAVHACTCNPMRLAHYPKDWIPANCAYTPMMHPACLTHPTPVDVSSPRTYHLLNSGLVILRPSPAHMERILHFLETSEDVPNFKFPDQDALAAIYKGNYEPLPWCYNALKTLRKIHKPMWRDEEIRCIHYILDKPWHSRPEQGDWPVTGDHYAEEHKWWWDRYDVLIAKMKEEEGSGWEIIDEHVAH